MRHTREKESDRVGDGRAAVGVIHSGFGFWIIYDEMDYLHIRPYQISIYS